MSFTLTSTIYTTGPNDTFGERFHVSIDQVPGKPPADADFDGARYQANGVLRDKAVIILRALADRLERGESLSRVGMP